MPDPTFKDFTTKDLAAYPAGKQFLDMHGTVWTKYIKFGKQGWYARLLSTGKPPVDTNKFRSNSVLAARMLAHYTDPNPQPKLHKAEGGR